jgi:hypothetical protein
MRNLQELYDAYIETQPSSAKIRNATTMMIHVCRALDIASQEEVTAEYFESIPRALDSFYLSHSVKAAMDKSILAEMIGRIGLKKKLIPLVEKLLEDNDENVRLFTLNNLKVCGVLKPHTVLPYIERYRTYSDMEMRAAAASLVGLLQCSEHYKTILNWIKKWYKQGDLSFVVEVLERMIIVRKQRKCDQIYMNMKEIKAWTEKNCPECLEEVFGN